MWNDKTRESIEFGNTVHEDLSLITSQKDIEKAIQTAVENGLITLEQKEDIQNTITNIVFHPELTDFFNPEYKIINERTLICQNATLKPDKVVLKPNHQALLLDYKTGKRSEERRVGKKNKCQ